MNNYYKNEFISPLSGWLSRRHPLPTRFYSKTKDDIPDPEKWDVWLTIEEVCLLHEVVNMKWLSLKESIQQTNDYLSKVDTLISGLDGAWLDGEEALMIREKFGEPPLHSLPIYIITCEENNSEKIMYIGMTKSTSRFSGGHSAAIKLHNPIYDGKKKRIYRASIWFHFNDEYIILEWIRPEKLALELLDSIESQLIYEFKPILNTVKIKNNCSKWGFTIHIQNIINRKFLNDHFVFPNV